MSEKAAEDRIVSNRGLMLSIILGISLTSVLYFLFVEADAVRVREVLQRGTTTLSIQVEADEDLSPTLNIIEETFSGIENDFYNGNELNQQLLDNKLWSPDAPGLSTSILAYLPRIQKTQIQEPAGFNINTTYAELISFQKNETWLSPDWENSEFFPIVLVSDNAYQGNHIGNEYSANPVNRIAMEQARDSGKTTSFTAVPVASLQNTLINHFFKALYKPGTDTSTVELKRENHIGYLAIFSYIDINNTVIILPADVQGMHAAFFPVDDFDPADTLVQDWVRNGQLTTTNYFGNEGLSTMVVAPSRNLVQYLASPNRWWALLTGILITAWISSVAIRSRMQSSRIIRQVNERTKDLARKTMDLQESESRYRLLAENITDIIYTHDADGICTFITPSVKMHLGYEVDEVVGKNILDFLTEESSKKAINLRTEAMEYTTREGKELKGQHVTEYDLISKDGTIVAMEHTVAFPLDKNGKYNGVVGVARNITERVIHEKEKKTLEQAFIQAQKMEAIGTLAGGVAHDFNNILTGILGYTDLLKMNKHSDDEKYLEVIENAAGRAKDLTSQLLGFARKGQFLMEPVNINKAISEVLSLIERTINKNIETKKNLGKEQMVIMGDASQINQLFLNLAVNGRDAMPDGGTLTFSSTVVELDDTVGPNNHELIPGKYVKIQVQDTGVGISPDKIDRIFEPFYTTKQDGTGTGMGLAMVYGVTKSHGGTITVDSTPGSGTTFTIYFPFSENQELLKSANPKQILKEGKGSILIVDDEKVIRDLSTSMLEKLGYYVSTVNDGLEAVNHYKEHWQKYDLVVVDMIMPKLGGLDCIKALNEINPDIKVILSTGYTHESLDEIIDRNVVRGFLQKPFRYQDLSELVSSLIDDKNL